MNKPLRLFSLQSFIFLILSFILSSFAPFMVQALETPQPRPVLSTNLDPAVARVGEPITLRVEISWLGSPTQWTVTTPRLETQKLELQNLSPSSTSEDGRTIKTFLFTFLALEKGSARIEREGYRSEKGPVADEQHSGRLERAS